MLIEKMYAEAERLRRRCSVEKLLRGSDDATVAVALRAHEILTPLACPPHSSPSVSSKYRRCHRHQHSFRCGCRRADSSITRDHSVHVPRLPRYLAGRGQPAYTQKYCSRYLQRVLESYFFVWIASSRRNTPTRSITVAWLNPVNPSMAAQITIALRALYIQPTSLPPPARPPCRSWDRARRRAVRCTPSSLSSSCPISTAATARPSRR